MAKDRCFDCERTDTPTFYVTGDFGQGAEFVELCLGCLRRRAYKLRLQLMLQLKKEALLD